MRGPRFVRILKVALIAAVAVGVVGTVVMSLWNWLLPALFGWPAIGFVQAIALLLLCRLLVGGWRGHSGMAWRQRMLERWERMTPEERERFRAGLRGRCGPRGESEVRDAPGPQAG
ncbi:MAG TPA: hypothetical protein VMU33_14580 [Burkholderiaceae bacterium]|nr:hypothetical protein [Burkholderiaceae bacterium]